MKSDLEPVSGILVCCVDVLEFKSQKVSFNLKMVKPFGTELIALKGINKMIHSRDLIHGEFVP